MRMKHLLPLTALLLCGCMTASYTETTQTVRPGGTPSVRSYDKPACDRMLEFRTPREPDGFEFTRSELADESGSARVTLLPAALQCLVYGHTVRLTVVTSTDNKEVHTENIGPERARQVIEEWRVQAKLGAKVPLRRAEKALLERAIAELVDEPVVDALEEMLPKVDEVPDWR